MTSGWYCPASIVGIYTPDEVEEFTYRGKQPQRPAASLQDARILRPVV